MSSRLDKFYVAYFVLHIAITLLVDAAIALPPAYQLPLQARALATHVKLNKDALVAARPAWLQGFVWVELLVQVPFFVWAAIALPAGDRRVYPAVLAYGVEASTTTLACLVEVVAHPALSTGEKANLFGVYFPTFVIPLVLALDFGRRIAKELTARKPKVE